MPGFESVLSMYRRGCGCSYVKAQSVEPGNEKLKHRVRNARRQLAINIEMKHEIDMYDSSQVQQDDAAMKIQVRELCLQRDCCYRFTLPCTYEAAQLHIGYAAWRRFAPDT